MSRNRKVYQNCHSKVIETPIPSPQNVFKDYSQVKQIISKRIGVTYTKKVLRHNGSGIMDQFLMDQVSSRTGYNTLIEEIFVKHSFNEEHFLKLRSKKEALFDLENNIAIEQSTNPIVGATIDIVSEELEVLEIKEQSNLAPWQEILEKKIAITKPEFHRRLNSIRDLDVLRIYSNGVKRKKKRIWSYSYLCGCPMFN
ncbi:hypothetical protein RhiirA4_456629 [Rhizophagus irregularis]|uniref:Uncharacterized protein n=1 Tax=Rhizophagus irregularis TaxID=588596 RepID=A0A2I1G836_9GLOM|nr:hypothetical protein RhiirA4_456629 [Rhizophagus irregularis]